MFTFNLLVKTFSQLCGARPVRRDERRRRSIALTSTNRHLVQKPTHQTMNTTSGPIPCTIFIIGAPGAGKDTQSGFLVERFGFEHLSYGDLMRHLRETGDPVVSRLDTKTGTNNPKVPNDAGAWLMWRKIYHEALKGKTRWLVNGFPRRTEQVDEWLKLMPPVELTLYLRCPVEVSLERVAGRGKEAGTEARPEDLDSAIAAQRIEEFYKNADVVVGKLKARGIMVTEIDTNRKEKDIQRDLERIVVEALGHPST